MRRLNGDAALDEVLAEPHVRVMLDLNELRFVDSAALVGLADWLAVED